jgi:endonuclease/exonuclease/phosphatase family metal-dependent hydrolase
VHRSTTITTTKKGEKTVNAKKSQQGRLAKASFFIVTFALFSFISAVFAAEVRIVTWNTKDLFSVNDVKNRKDDLKKMAETVKPDILCIQEVTSLAIVQEVRKVMELNDYHVAASDFVQSDSQHRNAFEVAIISKYPFTQVIEYDPSPDNREDEGDPEEISLEPMLKIGIRDVGTSRGYLWARIDEVKLTVAVVHLKSSVGRKGWADRGNAEKRELVAAAVAAGVNEDKDLFKGYSFLVAGDFNVGHSDQEKNGDDLEADCYSNCGNKDRYDETHALLSEGLVSELKMKNLALHITDSTYPSYPGSPIDNIYLDGASLNKFSNATKSSEAFGSDHVPVWTVFTLQ